MKKSDKKMIMCLTKKLEIGDKKEIHFQLELMHINNSEEKKLILAAYNASTGDNTLLKMDCLEKVENLKNELNDLNSNRSLKWLKNQIYQLFKSQLVMENLCEAYSIKATIDLIKNLSNILNGKEKNHLKETDNEKLLKLIKEYDKKTEIKKKTYPQDIDIKTHLRILDYEEIITIQEILKNYTNNDEFSYNLIKWFYDEKFKRECVYKVFTPSIMDNLPDYLRFSIDDIYNKKNNFKYEGQNYVKKEIKEDKEYDLLFNIINLSQLKNTRLTHSISDTVSIVSDPETCKVIKEKAIKIQNDLHYQNSTIIEAIPIEITKYENTLEKDGVSFKIKWKSKKSVFYTPHNGDTGYNIKEIKESLVNRGEVVNNQEITNALSALIKEFENRDLMRVETTIQKPGFYYDEEKDKINIVKYKLENFTRKELIEGVEVLELLKNFYTNHLDKLATILKWGWISPFFFAMKQKGNKSVCFLSHSGIAGVGKTTDGEIILYLWNHPEDGANEISGAKAGSIARLGDILSKGTFPTLINETEAVFKRIEMVEMIKTSVYGIIARSRYEGASLKSFPALSPLIFTQNGYLPEDDGIIRRFYDLQYGLSERKTKEEIQKFKETFIINNPKLCLLNKLKYISYYIATEIINDPKLLDLDYEELCKLLLYRLYTDLNLEYPNWLNYSVERYDAIKMYDMQEETIRTFLANEINYAHRERVTDATYTSDGLDNYLNLDRDEGIDLRIDTVLSKQLIPWMIAKKTRNGEYLVCLTSEFPRKLKAITGINYNLKTLGEILNFKYQSQYFGKKVNSDKEDNKKVICTEMESFKKYIFPTET
jgi:hypothetical protein